MITQGCSRLPILNALVSAGGSGIAATITSEVLVGLGEDPKVEALRQTVANARHDLKGRGCVIDGVTRGTWAVTAAGLLVHGGAPLPPYVRAPKAVRAPKTLAVVETETVEETPVTVTETETVAVEETPVTVTETVAVEEVTEFAKAVEETPVTETETVADTVATPKRRLKVATVVATVAVPEWVSDEGIRTLMVENTECFGLWSAKAQPCGECFLAGWCRNAKAAILTVLASKIKTDDPANPTAVTPSVAQLDSEVGKGNAPDASRTAPAPEGEGFTVKATIDTVCGLTGAAIRKGDTVRYVRGTGLVLVK